MADSAAILTDEGGDVTEEQESKAIVRASDELTSVAGVARYAINNDHRLVPMIATQSALALDRAAVAHYTLVIRNRYLEATAFPFQDFVVDILERRHPGDFDRVRPTGRIGDRKCDGRIRSSNTIIACYGPRQMGVTEVIQKTRSDFDGALREWPNMKIFRFVHNDPAGLGPDVVKALDELRDAHPDVVIEVWGFNELKQEALRLSEADLIELYGYAPSATEQVTIASLLPVVEHVGRVPAPTVASVRAVPPYKVAYNELGEDVQVLLGVGMRKVDVVRKYFDEYHDPKLGDEVAEALRQHYEAYRDRGLGQDEIFSELQVLASGSQGLHQGAAHQNAVYAVLAFFFEECDVYEEPPEGWTP